MGSRGWCGGHSVHFFFKETYVVARMASAMEFTSLVDSGLKTTYLVDEISLCPRTRARVL